VRGGCPRLTAAGGAGRSGEGQQDSPGIVPVRGLQCQSPECDGSGLTVAWLGMQRQPEVCAAHAELPGAFAVPREPRGCHSALLRGSPANTRAGPDPQLLNGVQLLGSIVFKPRGTRPFQ
jgi:hypothetical protein